LIDGHSIDRRSWPDWSVEALPEDIIPAKLKAADVLLNNGRIVHGGGSNPTQEPRRANSWGFIPNFLAHYEPWPFVARLPMELAMTPSPRVQRILNLHSQFLVYGPGSWQLAYIRLVGMLKVSGVYHEIEQVKTLGLLGK
jgi:ectoine hydroxylase-related dioxygenase (phytanoyl-CoA dioxygenase family)